MEAQHRKRMSWTYISTTNNDASDDDDEPSSPGDSNSSCVCGTQQTSATKKKQRLVYVVDSLTETTTRSPCGVSTSSCGDRDSRSSSSSSNGMMTAPTATITSNEERGLRKHVFYPPGGVGNELRTKQGYFFETLLEAYMREYTGALDKRGFITNVIMPHFPRGFRDHSNHGEEAPLSEEEAVTKISQKIRDVRKRMVDVLQPPVVSLGLPITRPYNHSQSMDQSAQTMPSSR
jgi:hypothetical protein